MDTQNIENKKVARWKALAEHNTGLRFLDTVLRGASQVFLQNNALTGLLFIVGVLWGAYAEGRPEVGIGAVIGLVVGTITAILLNSDEKSLRDGLFGFNGILVGAGVLTFLEPTPLAWIFLIIGASFSTITMLAVSNVLKTWSVPALTFPFVLTTWFILLSAYSFHGLPIAAMGPSALPLQVSDAAASNSACLSCLIGSVLKGPAQVFLINDVLTGVIVLIGLAVCSPWAAAFALAGSITGLVCATLLGAQASAANAGLYEFSPVLTAVALGSVFYKPSVRVALFALLGTLSTVIVAGALNTALGPVGIVSLTAPFVFVTWLFLLPKANLKPHPHEILKDGLLITKKSELFMRKSFPE